MNTIDRLQLIRFEFRKHIMDSFIILETNFVRFFFNYLIKVPTL